MNEKIKELRKKKKLSQEELGKKIGVSRGAIARYESGEMRPKADKLYLLSKALDHDFFSDILSTNNKLTESNNQLEYMIHDILEPDVIVKTLLDEMGYEHRAEIINGRWHWLITDEDGRSYDVNEEKMFPIIDVFIEHMKIDFRAFLDGVYNYGNGEETEEKTE